MIEVHPLLKRIVLMRPQLDVAPAEARIDGRLITARTREATRPCRLCDRVGRVAVLLHPDAFDDSHRWLDLCPDHQVELHRAMDDQRAREGRL